MINIKTIKVKSNFHKYSIYIGNGILSMTGDYCRLHKLGEKIVVISNRKVFSLYGNIVIRSLKKKGFLVKNINIPDGETAKNLETVKKVYYQIAGYDLDRSSTIIALGGGVVGDLAGMVAATYLRGINFVQIPTTILAQVDSSIGGKTGVNLSAGKNLIGCFYQPRFVVADIDTLKTLPAREIKTGMAEVVKYGVIKSPALFRKLENFRGSFKNIPVDFIVECAKIKANIVSLDEKESGVRVILNFGHTVGHALETITDYKKYTHGEAIAIGMIAASEIAIRLGLFSNREKDRLKNILLKVGFKIDRPKVNLSEMLRIMQKDKKNKQEKIVFVLPTGIGKVRIVSWVNKKIIKDSI